MEAGCLGPSPAPEFGRHLGTRVDPERRAQLLDTTRAVEHEPCLFGMSAHRLAVGRVP